MLQTRDLVTGKLWFLNSYRGVGSQSKSLQERERGDAGAAATIAPPWPRGFFTYLGSSIGLCCGVGGLQPILQPPHCSNQHLSLIGSCLTEKALFRTAGRPAKRVACPPPQPTKNQLCCSLPPGKWKSSMATMWCCGWYGTLAAISAGPLLLRGMPCLGSLEPLLYYY